MCCWNLAWRVLSITLLACEMSAVVHNVHSLALPFFGIGMKTDLFQPCGHCCVFQICQRIECSTLTASFLRIWNSSAGIPSPPLAFSIVNLPKSHLTSHSRMSGSRWVITSSWSFKSLRSFFSSFQLILAHKPAYCSMKLNSAVATRLEKVSFHSHLKERQCQKTFKLPYNCTHFTC